MTELKPCPFCGSDLIVMMDCVDEILFVAECMECGGSGGIEDSAEKAAKAWNTRAEVEK